MCLRPRILETAGFYGLPLPSVGGTHIETILPPVKNNFLMSPNTYLQFCNIYREIPAWNARKARTLDFRK